jgi:hypothetical protein
MKSSKKYSNSLQSKSIFKKAGAFMSVASLALACGSVFASPQTKSVNHDPLNSGNIEVIEVTGQRPIRLYRSALLRAEKALYKEYNKYADNKDFIISCRNEQIKLDSRRKEQRCIPQYEKRLAKQETQFILSRIGSSLSGPGANPNAALSGGVTVNDAVGFLLNVNAIARGALPSKILEKKREHFQDMIEQIKEHPELMQKLIEYVTAKQQYEQRLNQKRSS